VAATKTLEDLRRLPVEEVGATAVDGSSEVLVEDFFVARFCR
jgi:hypothetical protein